MPNVFSASLVHTAKKLIPVCSIKSTLDLTGLLLLSMLMVNSSYGNGSGGLRVSLYIMYDNFTRSNVKFAKFLD